MDPARPNARGNGLSPGRLYDLRRRMRQGFHAPANARATQHSRGSRNQPRRGARGGGAQVRPRIIGSATMTVARSTMTAARRTIVVHRASIVVHRSAIVVQGSAVVMKGCSIGDEGSSTIDQGPSRIDQGPAVVVHGSATVVHGPATVFDCSISLGFAATIYAKSA